jgi:hypothetical protein
MHGFTQIFTEAFSGSPDAENQMVKPSHATFWDEIEAKSGERRLQHPNFTLSDFNMTKDMIDRAPAANTRQLA